MFKCYLLGLSGSLLPTDICYCIGLISDGWNRGESHCYISLTIKDHLNSIEPSIQFTLELETNWELSFLDTLIYHHEDGTITTKVYRKQTYSNQYLQFDSHHGMAHRTLFSRAKGVCINVWDKNRTIYTSQMHWRTMTIHW